MRAFYAGGLAFFLAILRLQDALVTLVAEATRVVAKIFLKIALHFWL